MSTPPFKRYKEDKTIKFNQFSENKFQVYIDGVERRGIYRIVESKSGWLNFELIVEGDEE